MSSSDLRQAVGQLLWVGFEGPELTSEERQRFRSGRAGGAILFARNLVTDSSGQLDVGQVVELNHHLHDVGAESGTPPLIAVDQEGGRVQRCRAPATRWPAMLELDRFDADCAVDLAGRLGEGIGRELFALGFDVDFAPVLDVHTNPENPIIGDRAFAMMPGPAADRALAFAAGLERAHILSCGKHFPGHGDTSTDSHLELPRLDHDEKRLREVELPPFERAAQAKIPFIMTAHVVFAAFGDEPATLSRRAVTELLRGELSYEGIVVSDDLDMKAIADHYGIGDAAVAAVAAGCDVLLLCRNQEHQELAYEALVRSVEGDPRMRDRVRESAARIARQKRDYFKGRPKPVTAKQARELLGSFAPAELESGQLRS